MLTHAEDMENLTKISTAPFILIEVPIAIPVQMVLCTNPEIYKPSIQHVIKGGNWQYSFIHHLSNNNNT